MSAYKSNLYIDPAMNIIGPSIHVLDLAVSMSSNCMFDFHISNLYKQCSNLVGWILRTFIIRAPQVMLTLYKSLVMSRLYYNKHGLEGGRGVEIWVMEFWGVFHSSLLCP